MARFAVGANHQLRIHRVAWIPETTTRPFSGKKRVDHTNRKQKRVDHTTKKQKPVNGKQVVAVDLEDKLKQEEERDFQLFFRVLKKDMAAEGEEIDEEEAREMFKSFVQQDVDSLEKEVNSEGAFDQDLLDAIPETFEDYYETMKDEFDAEGMSEIEAREFYAMMKDQFSPHFLPENDSSASAPSTKMGDDSKNSMPPLGESALAKEEMFEEMYNQMKQEMGADAIDKAQARAFYEMMEEQSLKGNASSEELANSPAFQELNGANKPSEMNEDDVPSGTADDADTSDDDKVVLPETFEIFYQEMKDEFDADGMTEQDAKDMYDMLSGQTLETGSDVNMLKKMLPDTFEEFYKEMEEELTEDGLSKEEAKEMYLSLKNNTPVQ